MVLTGNRIKFECPAIWQETNQSRIPASRVGAEKARLHCQGQMRILEATWQSQENKLGLDNSAFFKAHASNNFRRTAIRSIKFSGLEISDHNSKAQLMFNFFSGILGSTCQPYWNFQLQKLYDNQLLPPSVCNSLLANFTTEEIIAAIKHMDRNSAPSPDGFGPSFFQAAWDVVKQDVIALLQDFYNLQVDLERINRASIVLQKPGKENTPDGFRPISLQNCYVKIISKVLANRFQFCLQDLIHSNQTGFLKGRSITENFILATELVQTCFNRGCQTLVLKLDFAKAFDSVIWDSLYSIMEARGFPTRWIEWVNLLLSSSKSAVLINGIPGRWINCKRGLRQGDPMSPYLFIFVADTLQRLLLQNSQIKNPIYTDQPCATIQYADDTLILCEASTSTACP